MLIIDIGDVVLYHFKSYKRFGSPETEIRTRPAIVTSVAAPPGAGEHAPALNLSVFFEEADFITPAQQQLREGWGPRANERRGVRVRHSLAPDDASDNTWSSKSNGLSAKEPPPGTLAEWMEKTGMYTGDKKP